MFDRGKDDCRFRFWSRLLLFRFNSTFRDCPRSSQPLCSGYTSVPDILVHPTNGYAPLICCFLHRYVAFQYPTSFCHQSKQGISSTPAMQLVLSNLYYIPLPADDKKQISLFHIYAHNHWGIARSWRDPDTGLMIWFRLTYGHTVGH